MAPLKLNVRLSLKESIPVEIEDDETVEALAVAIFSLKPDLGMELRLAHKGRPLKEDQELREAGVKSGDVIAVAKKIQKLSPTPEAEVPAAVAPAAKAPSAEVPAAAAPAVAEPAPAPAAPAAPEPAPAAAAAVEPAAAAPAAAEPAAKEPSAPDASAPAQEAEEAAPAAAAKPASPAAPSPATLSGDAAAPVAAAAAAVPKVVSPPPTPMAAPASPPSGAQPVPKDLAHHHAEAATLEAAPTAEAAPAEDAQMETKEGECDARQDAPAEAPAEAPVDASAQAAAPQEAAAAEQPAGAPGSPSNQEPEEDICADNLLAMARRLESGDADAHPGELAAFLRRAAARMQVFESTLGEAGHALQLLNHLSAHALRGMNSTLHGLPQPAEPQDGTKSFLIKKGDQDVQEAHRAAALQRPSTSCGTANSHSGGVLSASTTPMTKEEMDKARQARLQRLEQAQADKKREQEEAAAKSRAKEAMFDKPFVGPSKPLGKF